MTVIDQIRKGAAEFASNVAIIEGDRIWTHAELWDRVDRLSLALMDLSGFKGFPLMGWLPNSHTAIEAELACLQAGGIWVSVNTRYTAGEFIEIYNDCQPYLLITDHDHFMRMADMLSPLWLDERGLIITDKRTDDGIGLESLLLEYEAIPPDVSIENEDIARLRYTSGTTGKAKAAILPHRVYLASLQNLQNELHPLDSSDRVLHAAPLTHASGALVFPILAAGGANVLLQRFDPEEVCEQIERHRITTMFIVPTILSRLASTPGFHTRDLSSLRTIMYGGAPIALEKLTPVIERLGQRLVHIYGMTEAPYPITTLHREEHWIGNPKLGSIGKPTTICKLKIVNESGAEVGVNEIGEILVSGPNVMRGYWKDEEETRKVLHDGWLATGDLGRRDEDGYYWIVDRKKDVIISGGFNVYAKEVETILCSHPDVLEAAVAGVPHPDWGEMVTAFVVLRQGACPNTDELLSWCRERLSSYKCPKRIEILTELPKNASGKILKKVLASPRAS